MPLMAFIAVWEARAGLRLGSEESWTILFGSE